MIKPNPILVVARGDAYTHWCHTMGLNPRRDAKWVHNIDQVRGYHGFRWVIYGPPPYNFDMDLWGVMVAAREFKYVEPCNWTATSGHFTKIRELEKELDCRKQAQTSVIAMSREI